MSQDWIETLRKDYDAMHPSGPTAGMNAREAFSRIQHELRSVAGRLTHQFSRRFTASKLQEDDTVWILNIEGAVPGPWTGTSFKFNDYSGVIVTDPSAGFSRIPGDHHEFTLDPQSGQFTEKGEPVTDDELVRRALDQFLKSALEMS